MPLHYHFTLQMPFTLSFKLGPEDLLLLAKKTYNEIVKNKNYSHTASLGLFHFLY